MKKKIANYIVFAILTILILGFTKVYAAKKLVCVYNSYTYTYKIPRSNYTVKENSPTIMIEQDIYGNKKIYTNNTTNINENWKIKNLDNYTTVSYDTDKIDLTTNALSSCPNYMTYQKTTILQNNNTGYPKISINFNDSTGSSIDKQYDYKSYRELINEINENSTFPELSCVYEGGWFDEPVLISQDGSGTITVKRKPKSGNSVEDWYASGNKLDFEGTSLKEENEGEYHLTGCPKYVTFKPFVSNTIFLNDETTFWNDQNLVANYDISWIELEEMFSGKENEVDVNVPNPKTFTCSLMLGETSNSKAPAYYIDKAFSVLKYVAIVLLITLSIVDFTSAIASQDNDILNKTVRKVVIRTILCAVIFLLPILVSFSLNMLNDYQKNVGLCGIGSSGGE